MVQQIVPANSQIQDSEPKSFSKEELDEPTVPSTFSATRLTGIVVTRPRRRRYTAFRWRRRVANDTLRDVVLSLSTERCNLCTEPEPFAAGVQGWGEEQDSCMPVMTI